MKSLRIKRKGRRWRNLIDCNEYHDHNQGVRDWQNEFHEAGDKGILRKVGECGEPECW